VIHNRGSTKIHKELLLALESARTRLAVAIAAETKSTPLDRWQYYLDTADRMRRCIRKLRRSDFDASPPAPQDLTGVIDALRRLPVQGKAQRLCKILGDIVTGLE
jgi:hypothetical protein